VEANQIMPENDSTEPLQQSSNDERMQRIEQALSEVLVGQKRLLSEMTTLREEVNQRYVDLRSRIELNNDKLDVVQRELRQFIKDVRNPVFTQTETR
jgi:hypothetical protein